MSSLLTFTDFMASGGLFGASEEKIDWSDVLAAVLFENKQLLGMLKWGPPAENIVYNHLEDAVNPPTILGQWDGTTFTPSTTYTQADVYRLLRHSASAGALGITLQVDSSGVQGFTIRRTVDTGVPLAGDANWTIIDGATATISSDTKFYVSLPKADESDASVDTSKARTVRQGAVRVFERAVAESETRKHISLIAIPDDMKHQMKLRTIEMANELAQAIIREKVYVNGGSLSAAISAAGGTRTFPGILQQLTDPNLDNATGTWDDGTGTVAPLNADAANASMITKALLNARIEEIYNAGGIDAPGYDGAIVCSPKQARQISAFDETLRRSTLDYRKAGYAVNEFVSDLGYQFPIVVERFWPDTMVGILDLSRIEMRGLQGDDWHVEKMGKTGRTDKFQLSGQFGVSVKNIDTNQSLIYKLATS